MISFMILHRYYGIMYVRVLATAAVLCVYMYKSYNAPTTKVPTLNRILPSCISYANIIIYMIYHSTLYSIARNLDKNVSDTYREHMYICKPSSTIPYIGQSDYKLK